MLKRISNKKNFWLYVVLILGFITYIVKLTHTGLWYDEAIEYFFSRFITGEVPGGNGTTNMYERICSTYQPPLYNVLMYFWLLLFDSEFGFRLAGVIITLIGAIGIFYTFKEIANNEKWAAVGTLLYIYTSQISYYALECAEYNLMLCCVSWMGYFYIKFIHKMNTPSLFGFFVFACLSVYSQYGAAFIVIGMYISLVLHLVKKRNLKMLKQTILITVGVGIIAVLPLIYFFLIKQMNNQGSINVSHAPVFVHNILTDFFMGIINFLTWGFAGANIPVFMKVICIGVGIAAIFTLCAKELHSFILPLIITWTLYFLAIACSLYGYNNWSGKLGTNNISGKYSLFMIPIVVVILANGVRVTLLKIKNKKIYQILSIAWTIYVIMFCGTQIVQLDFYNWKKDDVREVTEAWFQNQAYESITLVHQWDDAMFQFYLIHNESYDDTWQNQIEAAGMWIRSAEYEEMNDMLSQMGYLKMNDFYYIAPTSESYQAFLDVVSNNEFEIEKIYEGKSALIHVVKQ